VSRLLGWLSGGWHGSRSGARGLWRAGVIPGSSVVPVSACHTPCMGQFASDVGRKLIAVAVLLVAVWLLFKFVIGAVAAVAWFAVVILAIVAVIWAVGVLR
jgi:hypothetical protein